MTSAIKTGVVLAVLVLLGGGGGGGRSAPVRRTEKATEPSFQTFVGPPAGAPRGVPGALAIAAQQAQQRAEVAAYEQYVAVLRSLGRRGRGTAPLLVISSRETKPPELATIVPDLAVMSRILDKALERDLPRDYRQPPRPGGIDVFYGGYEGTEPQPVYLQGYGALFVTSIKFPLVSPPTRKHEEDKEEADSPWERARREVYGPPEPPKPSASAGPTYDAEKVEALKRTLLSALKHASNIRGLKPDESVAIAVLGGATAVRAVVGPLIDFPFGDQFGGGGFGGAGGGFGPGGGGGGFGAGTGLRNIVVSTGPAQRTVLTVHVTKADVDAYAEGKLDSAGFREKATITAY